jgi:superfamily II DNA or RNA helicase
MSLYSTFTSPDTLLTSLDCETTQSEREAIFARYSSGETRVLCNVAVLDTGLDVDVRCIADARPTHSRIRHVQCVGRGLRIADGKLDLIVLDFGGNTKRLGAITEINVRHLLKSSDESAGLDNVSEPDPNDPRSGPRNVLEKKGELIELELAAPVAREPKGEREIFYAMLAHYSRCRGYKAGLAAVNFQEMYGYFPNALLRRLAPIPPWRSRQSRSVHRRLR